MKTNKLTLFLGLFMLSSLSYAQDYAFKVLANKGSNEVKSGDTWQPVKTGYSLKKEDELKVADNAYIGLVHATGKPVEIKQSGSYKVADLAEKVNKGSGASVLTKYTDFILSSNSAEAKKEPPERHRSCSSRRSVGDTTYVAGKSIFRDLQQYGYCQLGRHEGAGAIHRDVTQHVR